MLGSTGISDKVMLNLVQHLPSYSTAGDPPDVRDQGDFTKCPPSKGAMGDDP